MPDLEMAAHNRRLVERYWQLMASNDFASVREVCSDALIVDWPQTGERIHGIDNFARLNHEYPAHGRWSFDVQRILAENDQVATETDVTDGVQKAHPISFFTIRAKRIEHILEYWPDPGPAPANRAHLVEPL